MKKRLGFTNKLAVYTMGLLTIGLVLSFILAKDSIDAQYAGTLACWTIVFTPIGTVLGIVLNSVVNKNKEENTSADGEGIRYKQLVNEMESTI